MAFEEEFERIVSGAIDTTEFRDFLERFAELVKKNTEVMVVVNNKTELEDKVANHTSMLMYNVGAVEATYLKYAGDRLFLEFMDDLEYDIEDFS